VKYLPLIWSGIWRKPGRTVLIFLQVAVAFVLFGVLQGMKSGVEHAIAAARADLLIVHSRLAMGDPLPLGLLDQIKAMPGVKVANPVDLFMVTYQKPTQRLLVVALRPDDDWLSAFTFDMAPAAAAALHGKRTGALAIQELAEKYGWKVGERIPLMSQIAQRNGSSDWSFELLGTFTDSDIGGGGDKIIINYDYLNEARAPRKDTVDHFNVLVADPRQAVAVADAIDARSANSSHETKSESIRELAQAQLQSIGDLNFLIRAIVAAVLVALLFATTTMMMQSIRERTPEFAVLKTLGFTDGAVFALVLTEAVTVCVAAGACGLALATVVFPLAAKFIPGLALPVVVVVIGLGCALLVGLLSAGLPAVRAARLKVVAALVGG
jgi:putative ABC transport system permease protein